VPYKDPEDKKRWERQHRPERSARRRELRHFATEAEALNRSEADGQGAIGLLWVPVVAGGALAACSPTLGIVSGGIILVVASMQKQDWRWWLAGLLMIVLATFFLWKNQNEKNEKS
jgi:cell division protein FtsW (lipid II flippase)